MLSNLTARADYTYFGSYNNFMKKGDKEDGGVMDSYGLLDLSIKWKPWDNLDVYAGVTNVLDKEYWEYSSSASASYASVIPGVGRAYFVGIKGTLK